MHWLREAEAPPSVLNISPHNGFWAGQRINFSKKFSYRRQTKRSLTVLPKYHTIADYPLYTVC